MGLRLDGSWEELAFSLVSPALSQREPLFDLEFFHFTGELVLTEARVLFFSKAMLLTRRLFISV